MLKMEEWMDVKTLVRQGHSIRAIAQMTGHSRNTIRKLLRQSAPQPFHSAPRASKLDAFKPYIGERHRQCQLSCVRLLEEIRPMGYTGSIDLLWRYVRTLEPSKAARTKLTVRFETPPGEQAQADWAYCGRFVDAQNREVSIYAFVMVLGFSRLRYVEFTTAMNLQEMMRCQQNAFAFFEGIPQSVLYDNMKQVKLDAATWNPLFLDFAGHYGFVPHTHAIRRPRTKGKVERLVRFVKDNFLNGRSFADLDDLNAGARAWLAQVNALVHGTTGEAPVSLWRTQEQSKLMPLWAIAPYRICRQVRRKADWEGMVRFERSRYSVPPQHAGHCVVVEQHGQQILIRCQEMIVAQHPVAPRPDSCVVQEAHLQALWQQTLARTLQERQGPLPHWQMRFAQEVEHADLNRYEKRSEGMESDKVTQEPIPELGVEIVEMWGETR